jgi:large subunit ribosomal protein L21
MEYAVVESGGKQYKVRSGEIISIDRAVGVKESLIFDKVLLYVNDGEVKIGAPYVGNVSVTAKVIAPAVLGKKVRVGRFTAKSRHRRVVGFRPVTTQVQIEKILTKTQAAAPKSSQSTKKKS